MFEEKSVTVGELRDLFQAGTYDIEIDTPDGFQPIVSWWDKGVLPMVVIETANGKRTVCARKHLIQRHDSNWVLAGSLHKGDIIITTEGNSLVVAVDETEDQECFDFEVGHPNHRYWGDEIASHNSGKSYIVSGNIVRDALNKGVHVVLLDSEDALKETWMRNLGVDPDHPNLTKEVVSTVDEIADCVREFTKAYIEEFKDTPREKQEKLLFVVDSLGVVQTQAEIEQFEKGELKGDKGIKAKTLKMLVANCIRLFAGYEIGMVATNHTYKSQDMYNPDDVIGGGSGFVYAASIVVSMNKAKLKADQEVNSKDKKKGKEVVGIRSKIKAVKTRFAKPFEDVEVHIPYETGMDPLSGLFEMCEKRNVFSKSGAYYGYVDDNGKEYKLYRKDMDAEFFAMVMREWKDTKGQTSNAELSSDDEEIENVE